jgi:hypothetical protein
MNKFFHVKKAFVILLLKIKAWSLELTGTKTVSALKTETSATRQTIGNFFNHLVLRQIRHLRARSLFYRKVQYLFIF